MMTVSVGHEDPRLTMVRCLRHRGLGVMSGSVGREDPRLTKVRCLRHRELGCGVGSVGHEGFIGAGGAALRLATGPCDPWREMHMPRIGAGGAELWGWGMRFFSIFLKVREFRGIMVFFKVREDCGNKDSFLEIYLRGNLHLFIFVNLNHISDEKNFYTDNNSCGGSPRRFPCGSQAYPR